MGLGERATGRDVGQDTSGADSLGALLDACERMEALAEAPAQVKRSNSLDAEDGAVALREVGAPEHQLVASDGFALVPLPKPMAAPDALHTTFSGQGASNIESGPAGAGRTSPSSADQAQVRSDPMERSLFTPDPSPNTRRRDSFWRVPQSCDTLPLDYLDESKEGLPPEVSDAIRLCRTQELNVRSVLALVRHRALLNFQPRPWMIAEPERGAKPPARLFAEVTSTHRRKHSRDRKCDEWRNNGGKKGVVCQVVPAELLRESDPKLTVARRQGKIRREGLPDLRYQQFNVSSDERPLAKSGPIILYHVLPDKRPWAGCPQRRPAANQAKASRWQKAQKAQPLKRQRCSGEQAQLPAVVTFPLMRCDDDDFDKRTTKAPLWSTPPLSPPPSSSTTVGSKDDGTINPPVDADSQRSSTPTSSETDSESSNSTANASPKEDKTDRALSESSPDERPTATSPSRESSQDDAPGTENTSNSSSNGNSNSKDVKLSQLLGKRKPSQPLTEVEQNAVHRAVRSLHVYLVTQNGQCQQVILDQNHAGEGTTCRMTQQQQHSLAQLRHSEQERQAQHFQQQQQMQQMQQRFPHVHHHHFQQQEQLQQQQQMQMQQQQQMQQKQMQQQQEYQQMQQLQLVVQQVQQQVQQPQQLGQPVLQQMQNQQQLQELQQQLELLLRRQHQQQQGQAQGQQGQGQQGQQTQRRVSHDCLAAV